ncbi:S1 family peptidase [Halomonas sp. MS1]|nr:S1 family peptidase [Halomonas sp. MS1]UTD55476.1 S1 family peptidase [Halomonas sp. MS1]
MDQEVKLPVVQDPQYTVKEVASAIRRWAVSRRLQEILPDNIEQQFLEGDLSIDITLEAENIIRQRGLNSISYDPNGRTIFLYTKRKVIQREIKVLPGYMYGCSILYPQGKIDDIGECVTQAQSSPARVLSMPNGSKIYTCGSSISPGNEASAGTLGCLVKDSQGVIFGLSNNHVTGACSHSPANLPIVAPGILDVSAGGIDPFTIGYHVRVLEFVTGTVGNADILNNTDAAIFKIRDSGAVSSSQGGFYDTPAIVAAPAEGMVVEKVGRTTGRTKGKVVGRDLMPVIVNASSERWGFKACVFFFNVYTIHGSFDAFSDAGDSGSLVVSVDDKGQRKAVGLIFAGGGDSLAPGGKKSLMLPLNTILDKFSVDLVSNHNV